MSVSSQLKRLLGSTLILFFGIVALCVLNYALRLNKLALYEMDWFLYNLYAQKGAEALVRYESLDRVLAGLPLVVPFLAFGDSVWLWHVSVIVLHTLTVFLFWGILTRLVPTQPLFSALTAALFAIYPAVESLYYFARILSTTSVFFTALSLFLMVLAVKRGKPNWFLTLAAITAALIGLLIYELPLGLELARPLLLWVLFSQGWVSEGAGQAQGDAPTRGLSRKVLLAWIPYLAMLLLYLMWRFYLYPLLIPGARETLVENFGFAGLLGKIARNYSILLLSTWQAAVNRLLDSTAFWIPWLPLLLGFFAAIIALVLVWVMTRQEGTRAGSESHADASSPLFWFKLAGLGLVLTGLGFASSLPTPYAIPLPNSLFSRIDLAATPGVAFTLIAVLVGLARLTAARWQMVGGLGAVMLIGAATGNNFLVQEQFVAEWLHQQEMWWQMTWRAPALKEGTLVLLVGPREENALGRPFDDFEISSALSFIYRSNTVAGEQVTANTLTRLNPNGLVLQNVNAGASLEAILVAQYGQGCLKILDGQAFVLNPQDTFVNAVGHLSNVDNILTNNAAPPRSRLEPILGKPAIGSWCYFYERAEWHRQQKQWEQIVALLDTAETLGLEPTDAIEWLPFIESLNQMGMYARAQSLVFRVSVSPARNAHEQATLMLERLENESRAAIQLDKAEQIQLQIGMLE